MAEIGFVILSHENSPQLQQLTLVLNRLYMNPPIVVHHDFSKAKINTYSFSKNVYFVDDYVKTRWGRFSLVEAALKGLQKLYENKEASPDYYTLLSASDYPCKPSVKVLEELEDSNADVFIKCQKITPTQLESDWEKACFKRYFCFNLLFTVKGADVKQLTLVNSRSYYQRFTPFSDSVNCWVGEFWHTASKRAALLLLDYAKHDSSKFIQHFRRTKIPDEAFFQTVFMNFNQLKCHHENFRYTDWSEKGQHPKYLSVSDMAKLKASKAHFARKLHTHDTAMVQLIDNELLNFSE
ncbi:MAG: beta-1,6-N-acetylglucosaminyltransferase [Glaciecola sp.]|jgi:hypothetical protein